MKKHYIVFEKPEGSKCWTVAFMDNYRGPATFSKITDAKKWVDEVHSNRRGWQGGKPDVVPMRSCIAEVELPE